MAGASGAGGSAGPSGGGATGTGPYLTPDATGAIGRSTNGYGVQGSWYPSADSIGRDGTTANAACTAAGHAAAECSTITSPATRGSFPNVGGNMCMTGTVAKVLNNSTTGMPDYGAIWGALIGFDFTDQNNVRSPYNAVAEGVTGIAFDLSVLTWPLYGLRVELPTPSTDGQATGADYWGASASFPPSPLTLGTNKVYWSDVAGGTGIAFDPTRIESVQFHVLAATISSSPYDFCIGKVSVLTDAPPTCADTSHPVGCRARGGAAASCWTSGTSCLTVTNCSDGAHACTSASETYDCTRAGCFSCSAADGPLYCPALGAVPAACWPAGIVCSTVVACGASYFGCKDPSRHYDCTMMKCVLSST